MADCVHCVPAAGRRRWGTGAVVLLAASSAAAQATLVLPPSHAGTEGTGVTNVPFGRSVAMRVQTAFAGRLLPRPVTIDGLALRADGGQAPAAKRVELSIRASTMPFPVLSIQAAFALNTGSDEVEVLPQGLFDLPALTTPATPSPFHLQIPFVRPFTFDPAAGALLFDIAVHGQPPGEFPLDATWVCDSPTVPFGPPGCAPRNGGSVLRAESATHQVLWGQPLTLQVREARAGVAAGLFLGTLEGGPWMGLNLPVDLTPLGAPGCALGIDMSVGLFGVAGATGTADFVLGLPINPDLLDQWIRFQGFAVDPTANAMGLLTSQPGKVQVCGWERVARVWATGAAATWGFREIGIATPMRISYR